MPYCKTHDAYHWMEGCYYCEDARTKTDVYWCERCQADHPVSEFCPRREEARQAISASLNKTFGLETGIKDSKPKDAILPVDPQARKNAPIARGFLDYFPRAVAAVAELSRVANEQHNPGEPMHWSKGKSDDHADCLVRHLLERGTVDTDQQRHSAKVAWRAMALLEIELESAS